MKTKILYTILFFAITQLVYGQEGEYSADKFITKCPNEIFIGTILEAKSINQDIHKIFNASINPITIGYTIPIKSQEIIPTYNNMMEVTQKALKATNALKNNYSFSFTIKKIKSYEELAINWGQQINPESLLEVNPNYKTYRDIVLIDINQSFFSIGMDVPEFLSTDPQVLQRADELIYANSLQFGRKVSMLIESYIDYGILKEIIDNLLNGKAIDDKSTSILANSTIRVIAIGKNNIEKI